VLLHGFGDSVFSFRRCWRGLARSASTVLCFDRPGHGLTSRLVAVNGSYGSYVVQDGPDKGEIRAQENPYTKEYAVTLTFKLLDALGIQNAVFMGHSTGGALAMRCALSQPMRARGLVLISPTVYSDGFPDMIRSVFRTRIGKEMAMQLVRSEIGEVAIKRAWFVPKNIPKDVLQNYKKIHSTQNWQESLYEMATVRDEKNDLPKRLHELRTPALILHGADDKIVEFSESQKLLRALEPVCVSAQLIRIDDCGHVPHEEFPRVFLQCAQPFLHDLDNPDGSG